MNSVRQLSTPELQHEILSFLRAGAFLRVAVEAAGVSWPEWRGWVRLGQQDCPDSPRHVFQMAVLQAQAQGRLRAETEVFQKSPMLWLKHGPGREKPGYSGWANAARAIAASRLGKHGKPLDLPEVQELFQEFLDATEDVPPIRLRLAAIARKFSEKPKATPSEREDG